MPLQLPQLDECEQPDVRRERLPAARDVVSSGCPESRAADARAEAPAASARTATAIRWSVVCDRDAMACLAHEWSRLADACPASLFATPEWVHAWWMTVGQDVAPRIVIAREGIAGDREGRLLAVWPLGLSQASCGLLKLRLLAPMGETLASGDRLDPLVAAPGLVEQLVGEVRQLARVECDLVHWAELNRTGAVSRALAADPGGHRIRTVQPRTLPAADLPATYEAFAARLGKKLRGHVRRQEQIAVEQQGLRWRLNDEGTSLESAIAAFASLHEQCWQHRGKRGNLAESRFRAFIEYFAESAAQRGWLRLHRLCDGDRTMAALMAFHHNGRAYYYQSGWDPAIARLSPGSLCVARAVRTAIAEGMTIFDFLRGDEAYKRRWSDRCDETVTFAEPATLKGQAVLAGHDLKETIKSGVCAAGGTAMWEKLKARVSRSHAKPVSDRGDDA